MSGARNELGREAAGRGAHASYGRGFDLDKIWPAIPGSSWPPGFTVSREQICDDCGRVTGGPEEEAEQRV